jgi:hypothetical protein
MKIPRVAVHQTELPDVDGFGLGVRPDFERLGDPVEVFA